MSSRLETYRVQAYNTAKQSENKMHDDTVAKRFGFSGGLVPGVDVMAYMMHMPVAKWGRAFLERGLIDARFVKPVYDGETADVTAEEQATACCRSRSRAAASSAPPARRRCRPPRRPLSIADYKEVAGGRRAQAGRCFFLRGRQMARHGPARLGGQTPPRNIWPISAKPIRSTRGKVSAIPACCSG